MAQLIETTRIARDVTLRYTPDGTAVANIVLPCDYGRKGDDGRYPTQWLEASIWSKRAEGLAPYLLKGQWVAVTVGDVHVETFDGRNGPGHKLVGRIEQIKLVGPAPQSQNGQGAATASQAQPSQGQGQSSQQAQPAAAQQNAPQHHVPGDPSTEPPGFDDDIPFS